MDLVRRLAAELHADPLGDLEVVLCLVDDWLVQMDRAEKVEEGSDYNPMHVVGLGICALLHGVSVDEYESFSLHQALGVHAHIILCEESVKTMSWQQISDTLTALQLQFKIMFEWDDDSGYETDVDLVNVMLMLMKRAGFWLCHQWRATDVDQTTLDETQSDMECLQGIVDVDNMGWKCVRPACVVQFIDGAHAMLSVTRLLVQARVVRLHSKEGPPSEHVHLFNHHREASIDDFYEMSMITDCMVGSIVQYKHKFQFLFHSISQVVYYHWPVYERQRQITQKAIEKYAVCGINLLPLLLQLNPEIPIFYEHTGAGLQSAYIQHEYSWALMSGFIFLIHRSGEVFYAEDVRSLFLHTCGATTTQ